MKKINILFLLLFTIISYSSAQYPQVIENSRRIITLSIDKQEKLLSEEEIEKYEKVILKSHAEIILLKCAGDKESDNNDIKRIAKGIKMHGYLIASGGYSYGLLTQEKATSEKEVDGQISILEFDKYVLINASGASGSDAEKLVEKISAICSAYYKPVLLFTTPDFAEESQTMKLLLGEWSYLNKPRKNQLETSFDSYIWGYKNKGEVYSKIQSGVANIDNPEPNKRSFYLDIRFKAKAEDVMGTIPYLQNPKEDEMTIMWSTSVPCRSWVEYGTDSVNLKRVRSFTDGVMTANNKANRIRLKNLAPATKYYYRVVSQEITLFSSYYKEFGDTVRSEIKSFVTWDKNKTDFRMIVLNDVHRNFSMFKKLFDLVDKEPYDLVVFNGDCFDDLERESDLISTLSTYTSTIKNDETPSVFIRGNHENRGQYSSHLGSYVEQMNENSYGAFSLGDTRFVILDAGEDKSDSHWVYYDMNDFSQHRIDQAEFLKKELISNEFKSAKKRILIHHIPTWGNDDEYEPSAELWNPILNKAPFNIALNGHVHTFRYIKKNEEGNTYPVIIGGGKTDPTSAIIIVDKKGENLNIRVLDINGNSLLDIAV